MFRNSFTTNTHPSDLFRRVAHHKGVVGNILRNHRTGADKGVAADGDLTDNGAVGTQGGAFLDEGGADLVHLGNLSPGVVDVGEDHGRAAEDAVFQGHAFVDAHVVLDLALVADGDVGSDGDVLADVAVLTDFGAGKNMRKLLGSRYMQFIKATRN